MATRDSTSYYISNKTPNLSIVPTGHHIAEDSADYEPKAVDNNHFTEALNLIELRSLHRTADAQIGRLLRLANVLDSPAAIDRPAEALERYAAEVRQSASILEETLHAITGPLLQEDD